MNNKKLRNVFVFNCYNVEEKHIELAITLETIHDFLIIPLDDCFKVQLTFKRKKKCMEFHIEDRVQYDDFLKKYD